MELLATPPTTTPHQRERRGRVDGLPLPRRRLVDCRLTPVGRSTPWPPQRRERDREGGATTRQGYHGEWSAVAGKPGRDHGGPCLQPTTISPVFITPHRKSKLGCLVLGLRVATHVPESDHSY